MADNDMMNGTGQDGWDEWDNWDTLGQEDAFEPVTEQDVDFFGSEPEPVTTPVNSEPQQRPPQQRPPQQRPPQQRPQGMPQQGRSSQQRPQGRSIQGRPQQEIPQQGRPMQSGGRGIPQQGRPMQRQGQGQSMQGQQMNQPVQNQQMSEQGQSMQGQPVQGQVRPPQRRGNGQSRRSAIPNPNAPVQRPQLQREQQVIPIQRLTLTNTQQQMPLDATQQGQMPPDMMNPNVAEQQSPKKKKGKGKVIVAAVAIVGVVGGGAVLYKKGHTSNEVETSPVETYVVSVDYAQSGRLPIDEYVKAVNSYIPASKKSDNDSVALIDSLNKYAPNSWTAKELRYANKDVIRENWLNSVMSYLSVEYPSIQSIDNLGSYVTNADGSPVMEMSPMLNGEYLTIHVIDYATLSETMKEDIEIITSDYVESGYSVEDYTYTDEMTDLMLDYLLEKSDLPTKAFEVAVQIVQPDEVELPDVVTTEPSTTPDGQVPAGGVAPQSFNDNIGSILPLAGDLGGLGDASPVDTPADFDNSGLTEQQVDGSQDSQTFNDSSVNNDTGAVISSSEGIVQSPVLADGTTVTKTDLTISLALSSDGYYYIVDDSAFDFLMFSSDDYRLMLDTYGSIINNIDYTAEDDKINKQKADYDAKVKAKADKEKELAEQYKLQEVGEEPVDWLLTQYEENTKDFKWEDYLAGLNIEDSEKEEIKKIMDVPVWVEPERLFSATYEPESVITYTWSGAYYAMCIYSVEHPEGDSNIKAQVGDGSFEEPAGIGTTVVTKIMGKDGKFHDVKVTLMTYKIGEDAVNYAIQYSEKNRGFDPTSQVKLICYEVKVENLENAPIDVESEMFLSDKSSNASSRTGDMYGFYSSGTIQPHKSVIFNDWATSTELEQKYVCWGKSFSRAGDGDGQRKYPVVWFKILAGSGEEVPEYNAQESYVNKGAEVAEETTTTEQLDDSTDMTTTETADI